MQKTYIGCARVSTEDQNEARELESFQTFWEPMLFELDEHYPISIEDCEDEDGNRRKGIVFGSILMTDLLSEWQRRKKGLADGKISKAEYTEWKLNWPKTTDDCGKHEPAKE